MRGKFSVFLYIFFFFYLTFSSSLHWWYVVMFCCVFMSLGIFVYKQKSLFYVKALYIARKTINANKWMWELFIKYNRLFNLWWKFYIFRSGKKFYKWLSGLGLLFSTICFQYFCRFQKKKILGPALVRQKQDISVCW